MIRKEVNKHTILALFSYYLKVVHFYTSLNKDSITSMNKEIRGRGYRIATISNDFYLLLISK